MKEYYNLLQSGDSVLWYFRAGLAAMIICVILFFIFMSKGKKNQSKVAAFLVLFTGVWTLIIWISSVSPYHKYVDSLKRNTYSTVEGDVENFDPHPPYYKTESFTIKDVSFKYSDYEIAPGFKNMRVNGGPISEGKHVKINYSKGIILQLWIGAE